MGQPGEPYPNPTNLSQILADLDYNITASIADFNGPTDPTTWTQFGQFWSTTITNVSNGLAKELASIGANPSALLSYPTLLWILDFAAGRIFDVIVSLKFILSQPAFYVLGLGIALTNMAALAGAGSGLAGLAGLGVLPTGVESIPVAAPPPPVALTPSAPIVASPVSASATASATAPAAAPASASAPAAAPGGGAASPPPAGPGSTPTWSAAGA